ncbi:MAG: FHA domain-containing protein [Planctomycetaceae bacterium]
MNAITQHIEFARDCGLPSGLRLRAYRSGQELQQRVLPSPLAVIGAAAHSDLQIDDEDVEDCHTVVLGLDGRILVCDLGSEQGTWRDGERVRAHWFEGGAEFRCGRVKIVVDSEPSDTAVGHHILHDDSVVGNCTLVFQRRNEPALRYALKRRVSLVGREPACKVQLQSRTVRPYHALLIRGHEHLWVAHIADGGETSLDGQSVTLAKVENDQELSFGRVSARIELGEADSSRVLLPPVDEANGASTNTSVPARVGCSEEFVLDVLHQFRQMQRETLHEMRGWMTEMVQTLATRPVEGRLSDSQATQATIAGRGVEAPSQVPPSESPHRPPSAESAQSSRDQPADVEATYARFDDDYGPIALEQTRADGDKDLDPAEEELRREEMADELRRRLQLVDQTIADGDSLFSSVRRWIGHQSPK